jgi:TRAP transporter TAXI family solute receptor
MLTAICMTSASPTPVTAQEFGSSANDLEIRIGNTATYSGPAAPRLSILGKTLTAYFNKINAEGGVNGHRIRFISYDHAYDPAKAMAPTRKLVEEDHVLFVGGPFGSAPSAAVQKYLNDKKVPQLFVMSGSNRWDDPDNFPWSIGLQPSYQAEARIYAQYLLENYPQGRIAVLYQNDEFGQEYLKGLKDGLAGKVPIIAEAPYDILAEPNIDAQMNKLKASGADILVDISLAKVPMLVLNRLATLGWKPLHILGANAYIKPVGVAGADGLLSAAFMKDPTDPAWADDPDYREWLAFMDKYFPEANKTDTIVVYAYIYAEAIVQVLRQCGDNFSRENVMKQAANLKGVQLGMVLPGIVINTSAEDFAPIEQMRMMRFTGDRWQVFGPVRSGIDPSAVSEGFKAIFRYGTATRATSDRLNANTVTLVTGALGGTYEQFGADLALTLDDGDNLRVLPMVGRGSVQSVADILYLKGVDAGIVRADTLDYLERKGFATNIKKQLAYITKLYNEEMHVIAPKSIRSFAELDGKTVAVGLAEGGTFLTAINVFERLGIKPHFRYIEPLVALEKLRRGDIDAVVIVEGKPARQIEQIADDKLHFVPVGYEGPLQADYLPTQMSSEDYPNLIPKGERVDTIAVSAVLAAYNWAPNTDRYRRLAHFVDVMFAKLASLQQPPFHPKWREVQVAAELSGWTRFRPAQDRVGQTAKAEPAADVRQQFEQFVRQRQTSIGSGPMDREALFRDFIQWQATHPR